MKLIEFSWKPSDRQLRQFGLCAAAVLAGAGSLFGSSNLSLVMALVVCGLSVALVGLVRPRWLRPLFVAASLLALPIGLVVGEVMQWLVFAVVVCPLALLMRLVRRDSLQRNFDRDVPSYWQPKRQPTGLAGYFRPW